MNTYTLNFVPGFDPYQFVEQAVSKEGELLYQSDGSPLQYMTTEAKKMWFRMKNPSGAIVSLREPMDNPATVRYRVEVFEHKDDVNPIASWEHQETGKGVDDFDMLCSKVQTIALGKALSCAGYGSEIEAMLHLKTEGEASNEEGFILAKEEPKKEEPKEKPKKESKKKADGQNPLDVKVETTDLCTNKGLKAFHGKTFREIIDSGEPDFCKRLQKPGVKVMITPETLKAAIEISAMAS